MGDMNNMEITENIVGAKKATPEEFECLKEFYDMGLENEKHQPILTNNRIRMREIEGFLKNNKCRVITGKMENDSYIGSFVEQKMGMFAPDIRRKLLSAGYTRSQVTEISTIYRSQRKVFRLKVSRIRDEVIEVKDEGECENGDIVMIMKDEEDNILETETPSESTIDSSCIS